MISDELLSAFLDHALPEAEMERVRQALIEDPSLSDRMAALASVDLVAKAYWDSINAQPLPANVLHQLQQAAGGQTLNNVVKFQPRRRIWPVAIAASALLTIAAVSTGMFTRIPQTTTIAEALDHAQSGNTVALQADSQLQVIFSFKATTGEFCRHFELTQAHSKNAVIACKRNGRWSTIAEQPLESETAEYQTATAAHPLDEVLDRMILGGTLTLEDEQTQINNLWHKEQ